MKILNNKNVAMKIFTFLVISSLSMSAFSAEQYGDVTVDEVTSIYDGDTFRATISSWPEIVGKRIPIRVLGIDTPELRTKCDSEKQLARKAKQFSVTLLRSAKIIELRHIQRGKYFRILADVYVDGKSLGRQLIEAGMAVPYDGGSKVDWCVKIGNKKEL